MKNKEELIKDYQYQLNALKPENELLHLKIHRLIQSIKDIQKFCKEQIEYFENDIERQCDWKQLLLKINEVLKNE